MQDKFKSSTVYQIYIKSFSDSNGDGIGDINGIRSKLPYIKSLGVKYIWVTPFFCSPMADNGYDVSDYRNVNPMFGTMDDCEKMIAEADALGLGFMFDMVFNHTSDEHEWFKKALAGDPEYINYYIFRDGNGDNAPTEWTSAFGGPAWEYVPSLGKWYLHLFDPKQPDLNWDNPKVREELKDVVRFWKAKGVKGFRFDVLNLISKPANLTSLPPGRGVSFCKDGPHIHEYIQELVRDTGIGDMITVGEMASTTLDQCIRYSSPESHELSMCFNFHHLKVDYKDGDKWTLMRPDLNGLRKIFETWQEGMSKAGSWQALFWCNHDQPRVVSRFGDEGHYLKESAKMLATFIHMLRGTPYIYQGEELGMTNAHFAKIKDYKDVESLNYYEIMRGSGVSESDALKVLASKSRDNGRTPMQWSSGHNAGFTEGEAWIGIPMNYTHINAESEENDPDSILNYYRQLVKLRKEYRVITDGDVKFLDTGSENVIGYERRAGNQRLVVLCNFSGNDEKVTGVDIKGRVLIGNWSGSHKMMKPYEALVILEE
ncbi:MAG: alpha,alpha-phosphotrehalase [Synergistaceae bacterium]|nr:alpha,alpha-phosphotrehalase [Synergistaceae bacterium]